MRRLVLALLVCLTAALAVVAGELRAAKDPIAGSYIVVFKPTVQQSSVPAAARQLASAHGARVGFVYQHALKGFAAQTTPAGASALSRDPRVAYVEADQVMHTVATQTPATWGLDRIDQRDLPLNNTYNYNQTGAGVNAYIIDTGMRATHQQFTGRVANGADFVGDGNGTNDCNGHGTHVAGTTGGTTYGVWRNRSRCTPSACSTAAAPGRIGRDRRRRLGDVASRLSVRRAHEPRRRRELGPRHRGDQLDQLRRQLRDRRGQFQRKRVQLLARPRGRREHRRRDDELGCSRVVLQLRDVPRHLRAGQQHYLGVEHERHRDEHDQRDLDGHTARDRGDRALPADEPERLAVDGDAGVDQQRDAEPRDERGERLSEPAPVLALRRAAASSAASATAATAASAAASASASADGADHQRRLRGLVITVGARPSGRTPTPTRRRPGATRRSRSASRAGAARRSASSSGRRPTSASRPASASTTFH